MTYCGISYEQMRDYRDQTVRLIIRIGPHQIEDQQYEIVGYRKGNGKVYVYIPVICTNCGSNHISNLTYYRSRHRANLKT